MARQIKWIILTRIYELVVLLFELRSFFSFQDLPSFFYPLICLMKMPFLQFVYLTSAMLYHHHGQNQKLQVSFYLWSRITSIAVS